MNIIEPEYNLFKNAFREYNNYKKLHILRLKLPLYIRLIIISYI